MAKTAAERKADQRARRNKEDCQLNIWISAAAKTALDQLVKRDSVTQRVALETLLLSSKQNVTKSRNVATIQPAKRDSVTLEKRDSVTQIAESLHDIESIKDKAEKLIAANSKDLTRQLINLYGGKKQARAGIKELDGFVCGEKSIKENHSDRARLLATIQNRIGASTYSHRLSISFE